MLLLHLDLRISTRGRIKDPTQGGPSLVLRHPEDLDESMNRVREFLRWKTGQTRSVRWRKTRLKKVEEMFDTLGHHGTPWDTRNGSPI